MKQLEYYRSWDPVYAAFTTQALCKEHAEVMKAGKPLIATCIWCERKERQMGAFYDEFTEAIRRAV